MSSIITKESVSTSTEQKTARLLGFRMNPDNPRKITAMEVSEEIWLELGRPIWRRQQKMRSRGQCALNNPAMMWKCDGDCELCDYRRDGRELRLDEPLLDEEGEGCSMGDMIPDDGPAVEDIAVEDTAMSDLLDRLERINPEAVRVGRRMVEQNLSVKKALESLEINRSAYRYRLEKTARALCDELGLSDLRELF